ncbi:MAG: ABC transporter ATP-binding protein, partial [Thermoplasmata archaeon]
MPDTAIKVTDLVKIYDDVHAVDGISFKIEKGEVFAFLGPNGAGKTTTVEIIETIRKPTSGEVEILGYNIRRDKKEIIRKIGVLPQQFSSFDRITVRETVAYFSKLFGGGRDIDELVAMVGLSDEKDKWYMNLSGGLKQRLGIAVALVNDPDIVFLDEPTTGLDPRARRDTWEVIKTLKAEGKTVFLTTHYMEEAEV